MMNMALRGSHAAKKHICPQIEAKEENP